MARIFISYKMEGLDAELARAFGARLGQEHDVFLAEESLRIGDEWPQLITKELDRCDYFLLLLSGQSALSRMVAREVSHARARQLKDSAPVILPVRVKLPASQAMSYDLEGYLYGIQQRHWTSPADTEPILAEILRVIRERSQTFAGAAPEAPTEHPRDDQRPLPIADPELPGAVIATSSAFYVERRGLDAEIAALLARPNRQLIKLKAPEQMGKSSLLARIIARAKDQNLRAASLSFQLAVDGQLESPDVGMKWFCRLLTRRLGFPKQFFEDNWRDEFGITTDALAYLTDALLPAVDDKVLVCLDNIDHVFEYETFSQSFLPYLRELYELGAEHAQLRKLRLVIAYSTDCYVALPVTKSPFAGVGIQIPLPAFGMANVEDLCKRHQLSLSPTLQGRLQQWVGGQPYLIRVALHSVAQSTAEGGSQESALDSLLAQSATDESVFGDHLRNKLLAIETLVDSRVRDALRSCVHSKEPTPVSTAVGIRLLGTGLVARSGNDIRPTCELYREYFKGKLR